MADKYICVSNVAKRLNCSRQYVYTLIKSGKLDAYRIGAKYGFRVSESALMNFVKARKVTAANFNTY
ncbi:MAG: helix-turn-helix domain-containing protein [Desulfobacteraceae bacterium]|nr:helix-turn-helix domain-containing protein [Desulfobacteraceae bacterium]